MCGCCGNDTRTEQELINEAIQVQDACNLSGVVFSFGRAIKRLHTIFMEEKRNYSTVDVNRHRICRLYASKIQSLTGDIKEGDFKG
jgi:hypothetical protein